MGGEGAGRLHPERLACTIQGPAALTCRCSQAPRGSSTCVPAPGAAAADPGSCPAAPSPLLPGSEAAAPSGTLPASSRRPSPPPALRPAPPRPPPPPPLSPAGGAGGQGRLRHLRRHRGWAAVALGDSARSWGAECKFRRPAGERPGGWRGPRRLGRDGHAVTRLAGLSLALRAPSCLRPGLSGGQGAESGRLLASYTRVARPRGGGAASPPGRRGAEGLTRFLPVVSWLLMTGTRTWAFPPGAPALGFPAAFSLNGGRRWWGDSD